MRSRIYASLHLAAGGEPARAVPIRNGAGCNLWLGDHCVTADSAELFRELAAAALEAAKIQEEADKRRDSAHPWTPAAALREALGDRAPCSICNAYAEDARHRHGGDA